MNDRCDHKRTDTQIVDDRALLKKSTLSFYPAKSQAGKEPEFIHDWADTGISPYYRARHMDTPK